MTRSLQVLRNEAITAYNEMCYIANMALARMEAGPCKSEDLCDVWSFEVAAWHFCVKEKAFLNATDKENNHAKNL